VKKTLADRLEFLISSLGVKKPDFARRIQYTHAYICMVTSGAKPNPGHRFIDAVCREFSVNPEWLANGKEPVFTVPGLPLKPEKARVLAKFIALSDEKQKAVEDIIDAFLVKDMTENEKASKK
jgi:hypothetical protein